MNSIRIVGLFSRGVFRGDTARTREHEWWGL